MLKYKLAQNALLIIDIIKSTVKLKDYASKFKIKSLKFDLGLKLVDEGCKEG